VTVSPLTAEEDDAGRRGARSGWLRHTSDPGRPPGHPRAILLTKPYSPTTTGKVGRTHKTIRAEFFTPNDRQFATIGELQAALGGGWPSTTPPGRINPAAAARL
jgi:hypothetical protein